MARDARPTLRLPYLTRSQFLQVALLALGIWLLSHYLVLMWRYQTVREEEMRERQQVTEQEAKQAILQERFAYVSSDAYVEEVAREQMRLVKPGEHVVRPVYESRSAGITRAASQNADRPIWEEWWDRFFASEHDLTAR